MPPIHGAGSLLGEAQRLAAVFRLYLASLWRGNAYRHVDAAPTESGYDIKVLLASFFAIPQSICNLRCAAPKRRRRIYQWMKVL